MKRFRISVEGKSYDVEVELLDEGSTAPAPRAASEGSARFSAPPLASRTAGRPAPAAAAAAAGGAGDVTSPLAATVISVDVAVGDNVAEGQTVVTLEAMKMNTIVSATVAGAVTAIHIKAGDAVEEGQAMVSLA
jgi:biotin carboxyl carrier protein